MALGQVYTLEGQLLDCHAPGLLALRVDGGGTWQLDGPRRMWRYVGRKVQITGTRSGFNMIDVNHLVVAD